jgi:hypothetical protein
MFAHVHIAVLIELATIALGHLIGVAIPQAAWLGCFAAVAVCLAREVTQHEYRWIEHKGGGFRANMPWYAGYRFWRWNRHSIEETIVAVAAATVLSVLTTLIF